ncbi:hypothetical protein BC827DRAFT_221333 [Russula dissimulans]|nr:hypothetical protein BC827DRAFT_221333 [Russula dissimulans]
MGDSMNVERPHTSTSSGRRRDPALSDDVGDDLAAYTASIHKKFNAALGSGHNKSGSRQIGHRIKGMLRRENRESDRSLRYSRTCMMPIICPRQPPLQSATLSTLNPSSQEFKMQQIDCMTLGVGTWSQCEGKTSGMSRQGGGDVRGQVYFRHGRYFARQTFRSYLTETFGRIFQRIRKRYFELAVDCLAVQGDMGWRSSKMTVKTASDRGG